VAPVVIGTVVKHSKSCVDQVLDGREVLIVREAEQLELTEVAEAAQVERASGGLSEVERAKGAEMCEGREVVDGGKADV